MDLSQLELECTTLNPHSTASLHLAASRRCLHFMLILVRQLWQVRNSWCMAGTVFERGSRDSTPAIGKFRAPAMQQPAPAMQQGFCTCHQKIPHLPSKYSAPAAAERQLLHVHP